MINIELLSNLTGTLLFLVLTGLLLINWRGNRKGSLLIVCSVMSTLFFAGIACYSISAFISLPLLRILEVLRDATWLILLSSIVKFHPGNKLIFKNKRTTPAIIMGITSVMLISIILTYNLSPLPKPEFLGIEILYYGYLLLSLMGLVLVEQLYRHTKSSARWAIKYLCFGLGGIFLYDFILYSDAVLFSQINSDFWAARGAVNAVCVPLIVVSIRRYREWQMELFISRHVIFKSSMILMAGLYLSFMAISGYYVRIFGGSWGTALQTVFLFAAIMGLFVLGFSTSFRAQIRILLVKHFYENKYDYREEWLGFTRLLAESKGDKSVYKNIISAYAKMMKCGGGALWLIENDTQCYQCTAELNLHETLQRKISPESNFIQYFYKNRWIINLAEYETHPQHYQNLDLPEWFADIPQARLIIPLYTEELLIGVILLIKSDANTSFNWEDYDLLKTMSHQTAGYIAFLEATKDLAEIKQFEAFNRLSAFIVHDIKNMVAQLLLVCSNAKKFKDDPEFLDDAFATIDNTVAKMKRLIFSLKKNTIQDPQSREYIDMGDLIREVIKLREVETPVPLIKELQSRLIIYADKTRLSTVLVNLIQNAQEATPNGGKVELSLKRDHNQTKIQIIDNGCGMDETFIENKLFKPFETTKGNAGMGIGVYESREVVQELGGSINVKSKVGEGTTFTIYLPLANDKELKNQHKPEEALG